MRGTNDLDELASLISVIVPCYNVEAQVEACIRSILVDRSTRLELVAVDDRSTDGTGAILDRMATTDDRMKVIHLERNVGLHATRKAGFEASSGELIGFVDADDRVLPGMFDRLVNAMVDPACDIALCGFRLITPEGRVVREVRFADRVIRDGILGKYAMGSFDTAVMWNKLYRRELLEKHLLVDLERTVDSGADYIIGVGCFGDARGVATISDVGYDYVQYPSSMSRMTNTAAAFDRLLRCYVVCLERYGVAHPKRMADIDTLYGRQFAWKEYHVATIEQLTPHSGSLGESLERLARIHPEGLFSVMQASHVREEAAPGIMARLSAAVKQGVFR